jgi:hypothetical protein
MALVRILSVLIREKSLNKYIVPIVPDEARTFGLEALFKIAGIFSLQGQHYTPVDADTLLAYREAEDGQILQEGICETGALASFLAAGTAYSIHGLPMIRFSARGRHDLDLWRYVVPRLSYWRYRRSNDLEWRRNSTSGWSFPDPCEHLP